MLREAIKAAADRCKDDDLLDLVRVLLIRSNVK